MPDDPKLTPDPVPAPEPVVNDPPTLLGGNDPPPDPALEPDDPPEGDWRDRIAKVVGDDPKYRAWLNRFTSEENYHKAVPKLRRDFSAGKALVQAGPPEDATPEEIAAYRKAAGVPEKADGYGLAYPEEMKPTEADTAGLNAWAEFAHERHLTPAAAKAAAEFYAKTIADGRTAQTEFIREAEADARAELRKEWGPREFQRNMTIAYEFLEQHMGDKAPALSGIRLADGRFLGKHPDFVRLLVAAGRATADEEALIGGDGAGGGKSIEDEIAELVQKSVSSSKGLNKTDDARLNQLYEARTAREEKQGRARATSAAA